MNYGKKSMFERIMAAILCAIMIVALMPANALKVAAEEENQSIGYGTVTALTGGTVTGSGTANVSVTVEDTTLQWSPAEPLIGRDEGYWVGINVTAPGGFSEDATYKSKGNPNDEYGAAKNFRDYRDGTDYIGLWFPISAESLEQFKSENRDLIVMYTFDWNADGDYEQTITFSVVPSENIELNTAPSGFATVTALTGGEIEGNATSYVTVTVKETELVWAEQDDSIGRYQDGYWVGINVTAPEGFAETATYKVKNNPTADYGEPKNFAQFRDGDNYISLWYPVTQESLDKFKDEGRKLTLVYAFDWDANGEYEQQIEFSVDPTGNIVLVPEGGQPDPVVKYTVTAGANVPEGGIVSLNGETDGSVEVEEGTNVVLEVAAAEGYQISTVTIGDQEPVTVDAKTFSQTIENIVEAVTVSVTYVKVYVVTVTGGGEMGAVSTNPEAQGGFVTVVKDSKVTITAIPVAGYRVGAVTINDVEQQVSGDNDSRYLAEITVDGTNAVDGKYAVEVTFVPNVYEVVKADTVNGRFELDKTSVEHDGSVQVTVIPEDGYTVDNVTAEGATVSAIVKDRTGIHFTVSEIESALSVAVTFKGTAKGNSADILIDTEDVALRTNETFFVVKAGDVITFRTEKDGMRMYCGDELFAGNESTQTIQIPKDKTITGVELYYWAEGEHYADWHVVEMSAITVVEDTEAPELSLEVADAAVNGYYSSDVTMSFATQDKNNYSGIDTVEYWVVDNGVEGTHVPLTGYTEGDASVSGNFEIDSVTYNSDNIKVYVKVVDLAGNEVTEEVAIKINTTAPTIQLNMTGESAGNALTGYFESNTLTITITDRAGTFSEVAVADGLVIEKDGVELDVNETDITWEHSADGGTHVGTYNFTAEGNYEWSFSYKNAVGMDGVLDNQLSDTGIYNFVVDKTAPANLEITYATPVLDTFFDNVSFGFYKEKMQVTIKATDDVAGIEKFVYSYTVDQDASEVNVGKTGVEVFGEAFATNDGKTATATFEIDPQFRGKVSFTAMDKSGQISEMKSDFTVVVVDNIAPGIVVEYEGATAANGKYYNGSRTANIEITEANFFEDKDFEDELLVITKNKTLADGTTTTTNEEPEFTKDGDKYTATIKFTEDAKYTLNIKYKDRSGNSAVDYVGNEFIIDTVAPVVGVEFDNNSALNTNQYKENRTATITVTEEHFSAIDVVATVTANGEAAAQYTAYLKDDAHWTHNGNVHTAEIVFDTDAHYTFDIACADLAGNASADFTEIAFTLDKTAPVGLKITYVPDFVESVLKNITFGFYKAPIEVVIEATDETAGLDYFTYTYAVQQGSSTTNEGKTGIVIGNADFVSDDGKTATASFEIPAQFRGFVSFVATDKAGNSEDIFDEKCVVVDTVAPGITVEYDKVDAENGKYFDEDREATIKITEANFFEKDREDGLLVITVEKTLDDGTYTTTNVKPVFVKSGDVYTAKVQFNENADYTFDIKYTDRAGNVYDSYTKDVFTVDKVKPELSIAYDNNEAENNKYYNEGRTATIKVVEHNFNAADIDFDIVAKDVTGTEIDLSAKGYAAYLQNQANWTQSGDTYTAQIALDIEGNYTIDMSYADLAKNEQVAPIHEEFCIDNSKPENLAISYEPDFAGVILETITFGFYQAPVQVTIEATDEYAGVDYFKYTYAVQNGASSTNVGKTDVVVESDDIAYSGKKASYSFNIPAQFRGKVSFTVVDKAGNSNGTNDQNIVVVDDVKPVVEVTYDNNNVEYGKYYNADRVATITVTEANFFQQDVEDGLLVIKVKETLNDGTSTEKIEKLTFTKKAEDVYTATREFRNDADYVLDIQYTDRSGNKADGVKNEFTIDKIQPTISVSYDNNTCINENQFDADRTATIVVTEHNFIADEVVSKITVGGELSEAYAAQLKDAAKWTSDGDVHTIKLLFDTDAQYVFGVECADMAGNMNTAVDYGTSVAPEEFTVDKTAPTELAITINDVSVLDDNDIAFDTFYKESVVVKLGANGDVSGIADLQYQKVVIADDYDVNGTWSDYDETQGIVVNPTEKFIIYMRAIDNAGNIAYANSTGIVVDDKAPVGERNAPSIDITTMGGGTGGLYRGDVGLNVAVVEPKYVGELADAEGYYSGLKSVSYRIVTTDTDASESGVLFDASKGNGATFDDDGLAMTWSGNMTIPASKFNSNNIVVSVTAVDNAGNIRTSSIAAGSIKIDITAPTVEVTYDNNDGDATFEGETYFNADRVATIVVTERNFVPSQVKLDITNSDGTVPTISGWSTTKTGGNGDGTTHTAHVVFSEDGDYTVAVSCSDQAGSTNKETVAKNSIAPWEFTIDKTAPVVEVDYDNDNVYNGSYYNETRVATIRVTEHNFETSRVVENITAKEDGKTLEAPTISNWSSSGDVHTATVVYPGNAHYTFDIDYTDKAGNVSADMAEHSFYVDKTPPTLKIEKVADEKAYGDDGDVGFVIEATDINFDEFKPVVTAVVRNGEKFETNEIKLGTPETITHGQRYTVTNLETDGIYRIECTVVDKAGNAFAEVTVLDKDGKEKVEQRTAEDTLVTFSVNRDGSTYEIDDKTMEVVEQYYVQNVNENLTVVEINVNPLEKYAVTLNGKELVEKTDYTVKSEGGDGKWMKYTYEVFSTLFTEEGEYKLVVSSTDEAKNNAFSDVKAASVGFVVDRTAPVVTVSGIAEDGRYQTEQQTVTLIPTDDGGALNSLVVNMVDEDGKVLKEVKNLAGDALMEELNAKGGSITFEIEEGMYQNVQIICTDCAVGDSGSTNTYETIIKNVSVSSSTFMILWANTAVRWAAVGGVGVVGASVTGSVVFKRRRRKLVK